MQTGPKGQVDSNEPNVLYVSQYCRESQRAHIAVLEAGLNCKVVTFPNNGSLLPKWYNYII